MLSAEKQEMPSDAPPQRSRAPIADSFGKVLSSIQGLQQRLDDFSIDDIARAHAQAHALIHQIDEFHGRLTALAKLKDALAGAKARIDDLPEDNFDLIAPDRLENYPRLSAIVHGATLIRMYPSLDTSPASVDSSPRGPKTDDVSSDFSLTKTRDVAEVASVVAVNAIEAPLEGGAAIAADKTAAAKSPFDQRLLNDVIEAYGEFAIRTRANETVEPPRATTPQRREEPPQKLNVILLGPTPTEPAFVQSASGKVLTGPAPEDRSVDVEPKVAATVPREKKQGEIDRQLKRIVKDYGEYDLYSHQKSMSVKKAVLAAFAALVLLLGGVYLLTPSASVPVAVESTAEVAPAETFKGPSQAGSSGQKPSATPKQKQSN